MFFIFHRYYFGKDTGYTSCMILGIDEVGRGAWAGPVVVGAVAIEPDAITGLNDSKLLSKKKRIYFAKLIRMRAAWIGIGWVGAKKIDEIGMSASLKLAARRSIEGAPRACEIIIDGTIRLVEAPNVTTLKKADQLIPAVSAASIIAKVARDTYMQSLDGLFSELAFRSHVGYGTAGHLAALDTFGPTPLHRMSFSPMSGVSPKKRKIAISKVVTTAGYKAETAAAVYLHTNGYTVVERNWKTKRCEIDIVAEKDGDMYCIEVKYRKNALQGEGFDYITATKQKQMAFAADAWRSLKKWPGPVRLAAVQVAGDTFEVTGFTTEMSAGETHHARTRQFGW